MQIVLFFVCKTIILITFVINLLHRNFHLVINNVLNDNKSSGTFFYKVANFNNMYKNIFIVGLMFFQMLLSVYNKKNEPASTHINTVNDLSDKDTTQQIFWKELTLLCGKSFEGSIIAGPANDTTFAGKKLIMHVRKCTENEIKIPFFVGNDSSRTWVLTRTDNGIQLKHDHRHKDGSPDKVTMYGGHTSNFGSKIRQIFPADQETAEMLPAATGNVWWIDIHPGESYIYNLRRVNTDRLFSVRFDLKKPVENPGPPWGWKD